jgi:hypothetical protein
MRHQTAFFVLAKLSVSFVLCDILRKNCLWLRHCATDRKVAGSIPYGVTRIFQWHNPYGDAVALGLTLTEMSTRSIYGGGRGKGDRCLGLTTLPPLCADCLEIWDPQPPGTIRACQGL